MRREKGTSAQMGVDFLIGMLVFAGVLFFVFQFMTSTVLPFVDYSGDNTVSVHGVGDQLYHSTERLSAGERGVVNLSYFKNTSNPSGLENEEALKNKLGLNDEDSLNITVRVHDPDGPDDFAEINGEDVAIGDAPPNVGASVARATRVGYREDENETVIMDVGVW
jgi:hypothetical protein